MSDSLTDHSQTLRILELAEEALETWDSPNHRGRPIGELRETLNLTELPRLVPLKRTQKQEFSREHVLAIRTAAERLIRKDAERLTEEVDGDPQAPVQSLPVVLVLENLRSGHNVGAIFRTAEALSLERIVLTGYSPTPDSPQVRKAAMGTEEWLPWTQEVDPESAARSLKYRGYELVALETGPQSIPLAESSLKLPLALLVGNERFGLSPELRRLASTTVRIPGYGRKNSLNVATALGIAAYHLRNL